MKSNFRVISMCSLMAAFAASSWADCPAGFVEGNGEDLGDLGVCYYDIPETGGSMTLTIPAELKTFKLRYQDGGAAFSDTINIHCTPQPLATTVSVTGAWAELNAGSLSIRNRINAEALGVDNKTVTTTLEKYQSEIDMYNCTGYCSGKSFAENTKKITGFNALSIVFNSTAANEQINSFELTVNQEPYDFGPMQVYNVKGLDKEKIGNLISGLKETLKSPFVSIVMTPAEITMLENEVLPLLGSFSAVLNANKANVALLEGASNNGLIGLSSNMAVDSVYFDRKFTANGKDAASTIALPFDISSDAIDGASEILQFTRIGKDAENKDAVFMKKVYCAQSGEKCPAKNGTLKAYKPYIVQLKSGVTSLQFNGPVTLKATPTESGYADFADPNSFWVFRGVFEKIAWNDEAPDNVYGYAAEGDYKGQFVKAGKGAYILPFRGFLIYLSPLKIAPANASYALRPNVLPDEMKIVIEGDNNETTVIGKFNTRTGEMNFINNMKHTYDLKGRRVNGTNNARGAYYGKKVLMK